MKIYLILILLVVTSACVSNKPLNLRESLTTEITANGSKVFQFSVYKTITNNSSKSKGDDGRAQQSVRSSKRGEKGSSEALTQYFDNQLKKLPIIALFCRKSYFVLDRLNAEDEITIRAECHDSATSEDYVRFKSSTQPTKL